MANDKRVQILLSTFNGERYLREQIESYFSLKGFSQCCIFVRDDGSTDGTRDILEQYALRDDFKVVYGENLGWIASYQWLIQHSDSSCSYFAFSDQDDVWMPDKIEKALSLLDACPADRATLFASRSYVTDEYLHPLGKSTDPCRGLSYYNAMVQNVLPGHTQVFNHVLRDYIVRDGFLNGESVDWWIYLLGSALGTVVFEPSCTVFHRQHGNNAVGYQLGWWRSLRKKLFYIRQGKGNMVSRQIQDFYRHYKNEMSDEYRQETEQYLAGLHRISARLHYLSTCKAYRQERCEDRKFRILYLLGKYDLLENKRRAT